MKIIDDNKIRSIEDLLNFDLEIKIANLNYEKFECNGLKLVQIKILLKIQSKLSINNKNNNSFKRTIKCDYPECQLFHINPKKPDNLVNYDDNDEDDSDSLFVLNNNNNNKIKPFICEICKFATTTNKLLISHKIKHSNKKPFKCTLDGCHKKFKKKEYQTRHEKRHNK